MDFIGYVFLVGAAHGVEFVGAGNRNFGDAVHPMAVLHLGVDHHLLGQKSLVGHEVPHAHGRLRVVGMVEIIGAERVGALVADEAQVEVDGFQSAGERAAVAVGLVEDHEATHESLAVHVDFLARGRDHVEALGPEHVRGRAVGVAAEDVGQVVDEAVLVGVERLVGRQMLVQIVGNLDGEGLQTGRAGHVVLVSTVVDAGLIGLVITALVLGAAGHNRPRIWGREEAGAPRQLAVGGALEVVEQGERVGTVVVEQLVVGRERARERLLLGVVGKLNEANQIGKVALVGGGRRGAQRQQQGREQQEAGQVNLLHIVKNWWFRG